MCLINPSFAADSPHTVCVCDIIAFKVLDRGGTPSIQLVTQTDSGEIDSHKHTQSLRPGDPSPAGCPALFITGSEWRGEVGARWAAAPPQTCKRNMKGKKTREVPPRSGMLIEN